MKSTLKRSEIIEKLKKILHLSSMQIVRMSLIDASPFERHYVLLISYVDTDVRFYQPVVISLRYGWIETNFSESFSQMQEGIKEYFNELSSTASVCYWDVNEK